MQAPLGLVTIARPGCSARKVMKAVAVPDTVGATRSLYVPALITISYPGWAAAAAAEIVLNWPVPSLATVNVVVQPFVHELLVNEPESVPFMQVRVSDVHELPQATEELWYAVTLLPLARVPPQGRLQDAPLPPVPTVKLVGEASWNQVVPSHHAGKTL